VAQPCSSAAPPFAFVLTPQRIRVDSKLATSTDIRRLSTVLLI